MVDGSGYRRDTQERDGGSVSLFVGAFFSVPDLVRAIKEFLAAWNENPRPFVWTAKLEDILKKIERARAKLESIKPGSTEPRRRRKGEE